MSSSSEGSIAGACSRDALAEEVECASGRGTRPEPRVSRPEGAVLAPLATPELRTGVWTRFGANSVLGDAVTEETLSALAESTRTAARSQGYAVGWAEGRRAAREQADAVAEATEAARREAEDVRAREHAAAVAALELAAARLHEAVDGLCATVEHQASGKRPLAQPPGRRGRRLVAPADPAGAGQVDHDVQVARGDVEELAVPGHVADREPAQGICRRVERLERGEGDDAQPVDDTTLQPTVEVGREGGDFRKFGHHP